MTELDGSVIDPDVPSVARIYDFLLGGKENYAADREAAAQLIELAPTLAEIARQNRDFLGRAVRFVAGQGVTQFLDIGAGLPTQENVHQVAQAINPGARTVYVDKDPGVLSHGRALLSGDPRTTIVVGDLSDPAGILQNPEVTRLIDFTRPVCLLLVAILHFVPDAADPLGLITALRDAVVPGSYLVMSHASIGAGPEVTDAGTEAMRVYEQANANLSLRSRNQVRALAEGFEPIPPGLVFVTEWRPEAQAEAAYDPIFAFVGRKP
ncbi:MAG TPA: SAM-dependent methyltransferase [Streptosporangiaceae bacterium]